MLLFLQENLGSIVGMIVMVCLIAVFHSAKDIINAMEKKRNANGLSAMTEDEKQIANQAIRTTVIRVCAMVLIAYFASLIIGYFL